MEICSRWLFIVEEHTSVFDGWWAMLARRKEDIIVFFDRHISPPVIEKEG